jgi:signal peptidase I
MPVTAAPRRAHGLVAQALGALLLCAAIVFAVLANTGHIHVATPQPIVELSDSMAPKLHAGDLLLVHHITADQASVGDIVVFNDSSRGGERVIHRAISIVDLRDGRRAFVTRGDANTGTEQWTAAANGRLGRVSSAIPRLGRLARLAAEHRMQLLLALLIVAVAGTAIRAISRRPDPARTT